MISIQGGCTLKGDCTFEIVIFLEGKKKKKKKKACQRLVNVLRKHHSGGPPGIIRDPW